MLKCNIKQPLKYEQEEKKNIKEKFLKKITPDTKSLKLIKKIWNINVTGSKGNLLRLI